MKRPRYARCRREGLKRTQEKYRGLQIATTTHFPVAPERLLNNSPAMIHPRMQFRRIAVYCGSTSGVGNRYLDTAREVGKYLAEHGVDVVYGGGRVGMMGAVAAGALAAGGKVYGVIPEKLKTKEIAHEELTELHVVDGMHTRKTMMASMADAFIALPGGWGTLEEIFEVVTWTQLNYHKKPVGLLNVHGYYDHLVGFLDHAAAEGFIRPIHRPLLASADTLPMLLDKMTKTIVPELGRWIDKP